MSIFRRISAWFKSMPKLKLSARWTIRSEKIRKRLEPNGDFLGILKGAGRFFQKNYGRILYYSAVALVLVAIAFAAERYRDSGDEGADVEPLLLENTQVISSQNTLNSNAYDQLVSKVVLRSPENFTIVRNFADVPAWNDALSLWETHPATDFCIQDGGAVEFLLDGIVAEVGEDNTNGYYLKQRVGSLEICYASLSEIPQYEPDEIVVQGDAIAFPGVSAAGESYLGPHLHLEVSINGHPTDFESIVRKNAEPFG